jgi:hypothetical protein
MFTAPYMIASIPDLMAKTFLAILRLSFNRVVTGKTTMA